MKNPYFDILDAALQQEYVNRMNTLHPTLSEEDYNVEQIEIFRDLHKISHPDRPSPSRTRLPVMNSYRPLEHYLKLIPNILCPICIPATLLRYNIERYFRYLRIYTSIRICYPSRQDIVNITIINTMNISPLEFLNFTHSLIGNDFVGTATIFAPDVISYSIVDDRPHTHTLKADATNTIASLKIDEEIKDIDAETHAIISRIKAAKHLPGQYFIHVGDIFNFYNYERMMNQFKRLQRHHDFLHQPVIYIRPMNVRYIQRLM